MRTPYILLGLALLTSTVTFSQSGESYPVFALNDSFSHTQPKGSKITPKTYQLSNHSGFKLDCSNYNFNQIRILNEGKDPDAIFIVAKSGNYMVDLNIQGETIVDKSTMRSVDNPKRTFESFEKGDTPILGIGTLKIRDGKVSMTTFWVTLMSVL